MAKILVSMPEEMARKIEKFSQMEKRSKSELLREALGLWEEKKIQKGTISFGQIGREKLISETEKIASKIARETPSFDSTLAIRQMREE